MSNMEQTLSIIKPDAVERNLENEIKEVFLSIMNNECNDAEIISFLMTLKTKGETVEEITGAA